MCVICKKRNPKSDMIRIVKVDNEYLVDKKQNIQTRGYYLCKDHACKEAFFKSYTLNRIYKCNVSPEVYNNIKKEFDSLD